MFHCFSLETETVSIIGVCQVLVVIVAQPLWVESIDLELIEILLIPLISVELL